MWNRSAFFLVVVGYVLLLTLPVTACKPSIKDRASNPEYFDTVFAEVEELWNEERNVAIDYMEEAFTNFKDPGPLDLFKKYHLLHKHYLSCDIYNYVPLAGTYADSALNILDKHELQADYPLEYAYALFAKGDALTTHKKYQEAYSYFYRGKSYLSQVEDNCLNGEFISRLANVYYLQEKYKEAIKYYKEAFELQEICGFSEFKHFYLSQGLLDNIAISYQKLGEMEEAFSYYDRTLSFIQQYKENFIANPIHRQLTDEAIAVVLGNKGTAMEMIGRLEEAEVLLKQSVEVNVKGMVNRMDGQLTLLKLASLYQNTGRLDEANNILKELKTNMEKGSVEDVRLGWLRLTWSYFDQVGQRDSAHQALIAYVLLRDSLEEAMNKPSVVDINSEFDRMERDHQLALLRKNNEVKNTFLMTFGFSFIIILLVVWLVLRDWRRSKKHLKELESLNQQIVRQHNQIRSNLRALGKSQQDNAKMIKIVAHDLRNPVGSIQSLAGFLVDELEKHEGGNLNELKEMSQLIKSSSKTAIALITDLMELDTVLSSKEKEAVKMDVTLKYCVDLLQIQAREKDQEIILKTEPLTVMASRDKIWRVFSNLINNAIKFSPPGREICIQAKRRGDMVRIEVQDQGIGVPKDIQDKIFTLSGDVKRRGTEGEHSFGFGLYISKKIIDAHEGRIWLDRSDDGGSTFVVELKAF